MKLLKLWSNCYLPESAVTLTAWMFTLTVLLSAFFSASLGLAGQAPSPSTAGQQDRNEIASRIAQLGSPKFDEREAATAALDTMGRKALTALRKAANSHTDPEVRQRAAYLVERIERRLTVARSFFGHDREVYQVAFSPDGRYLLSAGQDGKHGDTGMLRMWDAESCTEIRRFIGKFLVYAFAFSPDGKQVATGAQHGDLSLLNLETGEVVRRFPVSGLHVMALAFSPDGRWLLSGSNDAKRNKLQLWDVAAAQEVRLLREDLAPIYDVAFLPDGRALSGGKDAVIRLWDVKSGREILRLEGHTETVTSVAASSDGRLALSSSWDHTIRLWDVETGREIRRFQGESDWVRSARFTRDGRRVVSASHDGTVRLWDVQTGQQLRRLDVGRGKVAAAAISPDGRRVFAGTMDGMLWLWRLQE